MDTELHWITANLEAIIQANHIKYPENSRARISVHLKDNREISHIKSSTKRVFDDHKF